MADGMCLEDRNIGVYGSVTGSDFPSAWDDTIDAHLHEPISQ